MESINPYIHLKNKIPRENKNKINKNFRKKKILSTNEKKIYYWNMSTKKLSRIISTFDII